MATASALFTPVVMLLIGTIVSLLIIAVGAYIGLRWMRQSGTLPAQQTAISALNMTLAATNDRMVLLEKKIAEKDAQHELEMAKLRNQLEISMLTKDAHIKELETKIAAQQVQINQQSEAFVTLKDELGVAQAALAEYAQRALPMLERKQHSRRTDNALRPVGHDAEDAG